MKTKPPLTFEQACALLEYVYDKVEKHGCDLTLRFTFEWLHKNNIKNAEEVVKYLEDHGGYCDCEVLYNAAENDYWGG